MTYQVLFVETFLTQQARRYLEEHDCVVTTRPISDPSSEESVVQAVKGYDAVIAGGEVYSEKVIESLEGLKIIARKGVGYDNVDIGAAVRAGILVTNTPGATSRAVAEMTIALMFSLLRRLPQFDAEMKNGVFRQEPTVSELQACTVGIVGMGHIGSEVIRLLAPFEPSFMAYDISWNTQFADAYDVRYRDLNELAVAADFVSIHVPLNRHTQNLIGADLFRRMKPTAYLINTSRGPVVDKDALYTALVEKKIAGAGIDVHWEKPIRDDDPLVALESVIATPQIAYNTAECQARMMMTAAEEVVAALNGRGVRYAIS